MARIANWEWQEVTGKIILVGQFLSVVIPHTVRVMCQLIDLDFPAATPSCAHPAHARKRRPHIETDMPIVPPPVPMSLWEEASARLDVESPVVAAPNLMRLTDASQRHPRIEIDTPIIPWALALAVWEEACVWLEVKLPRSWIVILAVRANVIYAHNSRFRRLLRRPGTAGRDWLWAFTRHWLAAMILRSAVRLCTQLPASYSIGRELPERRHGSTN